MNWRWIETPAIDASTNMAVDQALLENSINIRQPLIRFYSWEGKPASFGYFQKFSDVLKMTQLRPLVRRPTGGGVVEHASDWTYSVIIPKSHEWWSITAEQSYERIHKWCRDSLMSIGVSASLAPEKDSSGPGSCFIGAEKDDLLSGGKKIGGAAQRRNKNGLLIQGSIQTSASPELKAHWINAMVTQPNNTFERWLDWESQSISERIKELSEHKYSAGAFTMKR